MVLMISKGLGCIRDCSSAWEELMRSSSLCELQWFACTRTKEGRLFSEFQPQLERKWSMYSGTTVAGKPVFKVYAVSIYWNLYSGFSFEFVQRVRYWVVQNIHIKNTSFNSQFCSVLLGCFGLGFFLLLLLCYCFFNKRHSPLQSVKQWPCWFGHLIKFQKVFPYANKYRPTAFT